MFVVDTSDESIDDGHSVDAASEERADVPETEPVVEKETEVVQVNEVLPDPHPALLLEDVLLAIFECADGPTRAHGATVSRRFMRPALASLWRKSAKMFDIFNLIAPLEREPSNLVSQAMRRSFVVNNAHDLLELLLC